MVYVEIDGRMGEDLSSWNLVYPAAHQDLPSTCPQTQPCLHLQVDNTFANRYS